MGMVVRTNTMALNAYRQLGMNNSAVSKSLEKLSSGFRINRAGDDAAGLAISEKMKAQITGLETASANAQDGISLIQTAEGNLNEVHDMLNRMVELATKSANGTYTSTERQALQDEVDALLDEINRISKSANFNGTNLLDGSLKGVNADAFTIGDATGVSTGADLTSSLILPAKTTSPATADYHESTEGNPQATPSFVLDLADFAATGAAGDTFTFSFGGASLTLTLVGDVTNAADLASEFVAAATGGSLNGGAAITTNWDGNTNLVKIGGLKFSVSAVTDEAGAATRLKFTYHSKGTNAAGDGDETTFSSTDAATFNAAVPTTFTVTGKTAANAAITNTGLVDHAVTLIEKAEAKVEGQRAGMKLTLDANLVAQGNKLTIDGQTFVFQTDADNVPVADTANGDIIIDVSSATTDAERIQQAVLQLASTENAELPDNFQIGAAGTNAIHVDQKVLADPADYETYDYAALKKIFSAQAADTAASTALTVDASKIKDKDSIKIGDDVFTFVTGTAQTGEIAIAVDADGNVTDSAQVLADFEKALTDAGYVVTRTGGDFTISAASLDEESVDISNGGLVLQIGDTAETFNKMTVGIADMSARGLNLDSLSKTGIMTADKASAAIDKIKTAINTVSTARAGMGALQNRLEHTINNLDVAVENLSAANSRIRDTDMAKEMMNYTKMNVLVQSAQAMLAQANQQPQSVLQLLQ